MANKKILIVEDEIIIALDIQRKIEKLGFNVCGVATTGKEAIQIANEMKPDLILMDIVLKGDMGGAEAAKTIHSQNNIPIVFLTAQLDDNMLKEIEIVDYLPKPIKDTELQTIIEKVLGKN